MLYLLHPHLHRYGRLARAQFDQDYCYYARPKTVRGSCALPLALRFDQASPRSPNPALAALRPKSLARDRRRVHILAHADIGGGPAPVERGGGDWQHTKVIR